MLLVGEQDDVMMMIVVPSHLGSSSSVVAIHEQHLACSLLKLFKSVPISPFVSFSITTGIVVYNVSVRTLPRK